MRCYLDHNATSPLRPSAKAAMTRAMELCGNASSIHGEGRAARKVLDEARAVVAAQIGCLASSVLFTSGGTEANNMALKGAGAQRLLVSATEHPSVIAAAKASGLEVHIIPVQGDGLIVFEALQALLPGSPALVSVMLANNETGVIQDIAQVVAMAAAQGALVHCDAVQALGKIPVNFGLLGCDLLTLSAHKIGGPQGVGALVVRDGLDLTPLMNGGGQEFRRRAGTENLIGIAGFAAALQDGMTDVGRLRDALEERLEGQAIIHGKGVRRLPNTSCFSVDGVLAEQLVIALDLEGCAVSSGSACSSGKVGRSHVLQAMGLKADRIAGAIRISLGWNSVHSDIDDFISAWQRVTQRFSQFKAA